MATTPSTNSTKATDTVEVKWALKVEINGLRCLFIKYHAKLMIQQGDVKFLERKIEAMSVILGRFV